MKFSQQWETLRQSGSGYGHKRLVYPEHPLNLWILFAKDFNRCFQIEVPGSNEPQLPTLAGFDIRIEHQDQKRLISFELADNRLNNVFDALLINLIGASSTAHTEDAALLILFERLSLWTELLKKRSTKSSITETIGLLAELIVLERLLKNHSACGVIVAGWRGPNGDATDIGMDDRRIEIKAKLSTQHLKVTISSADQLTCDERDLFLAVAFFVQSESGISLNQLIQKIRALLLSSPSTLDLFESKLIVAGYQEDSPESDKMFELIKIRTFQVCDKFPRIESNELRTGISRIVYDIDIASIEKYECNSTLALTVKNEN